MSRTAEDILAEIAFIDEVVPLLQDAIKNSAGKAAIKVRELDDSQVKIKTEYRSMTEALDGLFQLRKQRNSLNNELYGNIGYMKNNETFR